MGRDPAAQQGAHDMTKRSLSAEDVAAIKKMAKQPCAICGGPLLDKDTKRFFIEKLGKAEATKALKNWCGHNPYPVIKDPEARCCGRCDRTAVIPTRIMKAGGVI
jgi:hypothetical protein